MPDNKNNDIKNTYQEIRKRFESNSSEVFEQLEEDEELEIEINKIFRESANLEEAQSKIILLIREHLRKEQKKIPGLNIETDEEKIIKDIEELCRRFIQSVEPELDSDLQSISAEKRNKLNIEAKKSVKKIIKMFSVYEIYKIMNPRRIAGETKLDNYRNNLLMGGEKLASKYEGGRESDVKGYSPNEMAKIKQQIKDFKNRGGGLER